MEYLVNHLTHWGRWWHVFLHFHALLFELNFFSNWRFPSAIRSQFGPHQKRCLIMYALEELDLGLYVYMVWAIKIIARSRIDVHFTHKNTNNIAWSSDILVSFKGYMSNDWAYHMGLALFSLHQREAILLLQQAAILTKVRRPNNIIKENTLVCNNNNNN